MSDNSLSDIQIAYNMTNVVSSDLWNQYYNDGKGDKDFIVIFDKVADLEIPQGSEKWRQENWDRVKNHLTLLENRYLNTEKT